MQVGGVHAAIHEAVGHNRIAVRGLVMAQTTSDRIGKLRADDYVSAFRKAALSEQERRLLWTHFQSPDYRITAAELAKKMGYSLWTSTNLQYGRNVMDVSRRAPCILPPNRHPTSANRI